MFVDILIKIGMFIGIGLLLNAAFVVRGILHNISNTAIKNILVIVNFPFIGLFILYLTGTYLTVWNVVGTILISLGLAAVVAILIRNKDMNS